MLGAIITSLLSGSTHPFDCKKKKKKKKKAIGPNCTSVGYLSITPQVFFWLVYQLFEWVMLLTIKAIRTMGEWEWRYIFCKCMWTSMAACARYWQFIHWQQILDGIRVSDRHGDHFNPLYTKRKQQQYRPSLPGNRSWDFEAGNKALQTYSGTVMAWICGLKKCLVDDSRQSQNRQYILNDSTMTVPIKPNSFRCSPTHRLDHGTVKGRM